MNSVFWTLVRKHMYLQRALSFATVVLGLVGLWIITRGKVGFALGGILFLTVNVASGMFIGSMAVLQDRKDQSRQFAMSLPVSGRQFELAKFTGAWLSYGIPWLILTVAAVALFSVPPAPEQALVVYVLLIQFCILALNAVFLSVMFQIQYEPLVGIVVLVLNMFFSLFMVMINQPEYIGSLRGPVIHWPAFAVNALSVEIVIIALAMLLALLGLSRKRDFI